MQIRQMLVSSSKYGIKCPNSMNPEYITIHNTANDASANSEVSYMVNNSNAVSFHIAVDDKEAVQGIPLNRNAWHAGDGASGSGNRKSIGIEICYSKSGGERFDKAENLTAELIAQLLRERGWGIEQVKKHQDWSGKYCPHRTLDLGWDRFLGKIKNKLNGTPTNTGCIESKDMSELLAYLGVSDEAAAKAKLAEHLGEKDGKCDWGAQEDNRGGFLSDEAAAKAKLAEHLGEKDGKCDWGAQEDNRGGFLGAARRDCQAKQTKIDELSGQIAELKKQPAQPPIPSSGDLPAETTIAGKTFVINGASVSTTGEKIANYKLKGS